MCGYFFFYIIIINPHFNALLAAPCFVKGLKDMAVMAEETIVFEAQIDGNPAPEVKWYVQKFNYSNDERQMQLNMLLNINYFHFHEIKIFFSGTKMASS